MMRLRKDCSENLLEPTCSYSEDMKARELFERAGPAAPVEAPPKPGVKPGAPARPAPTKHPNPFRRRRPGVDPGPMPKPKACRESISAKNLIRGLR